jgi:hypothetical protein
MKMEQEAAKTSGDLVKTPRKFYNGHEVACMERKCNHILPL